MCELRCGEELKDFLSKSYVEHYFSRKPMKEIHSQKDIHQPGQLRKVTFPILLFLYLIESPSKIQKTNQGITVLGKVHLQVSQCTLEEAIHQRGYQLVNSTTSETESVQLFEGVTDKDGKLINLGDYVCWTQNGEVRIIMAFKSKLFTFLKTETLWRDGPFFCDYKWEVCHH